MWICATYNTLGKAYCPSKQIPEVKLYIAAIEAMGTVGLDEKLFCNEITAVRVLADNVLVFVFQDGHESVKRWQNRSRSESWTQEMREAASRKAAERNANR